MNPFIFFTKPTLDQESLLKVELLVCPVALQADNKNIVQIITLVYNNVKAGYDDDTLDRIESFFLDMLDGKESIDVSQARMNRLFNAYLGEAILERAESRAAKWHSIL